MTYTEDSIVFRPFPKAHNFIDHTGQRFGRWLVLGYAGRYKRPFWWCRCDCGAIGQINPKNLRAGASLSCGCLKSEVTVTRLTKHGDASVTERCTEYQAYIGAKNRCCNPLNSSYPNYGGRGIQFRFDSYPQFLQLLGRKPSALHSLDRFPNNKTGHYEPGNVRWATDGEQTRNRRITRNLTYNGITQCIADWADQLGLVRTTLYQRINTGWCAECALQPVRSGACCSHKT